MNGIIKYVYLENEVDFEISKQDVMVNATEMGEIFGKKPYDFYHTETVQNFIKAFCQSDNCRFEDEFTPNGKLVKVLKGNIVQGTWMHRVVALKFAAWLDPDFDVWVFKTIDKLINSYFKEQRDALIESLTAKQQKKLKKEEILAKYANLPEIAEYFDLEKSESEAKNKRFRSIRAQMSQLKLEFKF